jgi:hypothetical protein
MCAEMNLPTSRRKLPTTTYVSLAEALTWIAFGDALLLEELRAQLEGNRPSSTGSADERWRKLLAGQDEDISDVSGLGYFHDRQPGLARLTDAWCEMREEIERGGVKVRGRFTPTYSLADARLGYPEKFTEGLVTTFSQFDVSTGGIRRQPQGSPDVLWRDDPHSFDREFEAFGDDPRAAGGYLFVELVRDGVFCRWPHPVNVPRKSHDDVVVWCERWIESGQGNGMDKAWEGFSSAPEHAGLSRDDVFRPAWKEAKGG